MKIIHKKTVSKLIAAPLGIFLAVLLLLSPTVRTAIFAVSSGIASPEQVTIILDPGHGGADPGAVGVTGVLEKDVNLEIALTMRDMLKAMGYDVVMTRETDISIHDSKYKKISEQKTSDIKNRLKLMREYPDALVVLVHQNKFEAEKYHGAQMFYGVKSPKSKELADALQMAVTSFLQPENMREVKKGTSSVYLLKMAENPIVLAECGFVSNYREEKLLSDTEYKRKMAFALVCGIVSYTTLTD